MTAINQARSRTKIYGWLDPTQLNFSTSKNSNAPEANDEYSNRFELNQFVLYAERLPDSVQRDHVMRLGLSPDRSLWRGLPLHYRQTGIFQRTDCSN